MWIGFLGQRIETYSGHLQEFLMVFHSLRGDYWDSIANSTMTVPFLTVSTLLFINNPVI